MVLNSLWESITGLDPSSPFSWKQEAHFFLLMQVFFIYVGIFYRGDSEPELQLQTSLNSEKLDSNSHPPAGD